MANLSSRGSPVTSGQSFRRCLHLMATSLSDEYLVTNQVKGEQQDLFDTETIEFLQRQQPADKPLQIYARPEIRKGCAWDIQLKISPEIIKQHNLQQICIEKPRNSRVSTPFLCLKVRSKLIKPVRELPLTKVASILHQEESLVFNEYSALTLKVRFTARPRAVFHKHSDMMILLVAVKRGDQVICLDEFELIFRGGTGSVHSADSRKAAAARDPTPSPSLPSSNQLHMSSMLSHNVQMSLKQNQIGMGYLNNQQAQQYMHMTTQAQMPLQIRFAHQPPPTTHSQQPLYRQLCQLQNMSTPVSSNSKPPEQPPKSETQQQESEKLLSSWPSFLSDFETDKTSKVDTYPTQQTLDDIMNAEMPSGPWSPSPQFDDDVFQSFSSSPQDDQDMHSDFNPMAQQDDLFRRESTEESSTTHDEANLLLEVCDDIKDCFKSNREPGSTAIPPIPSQFTIVYGKKRGMCVDCLTECQCYIGSGGPCSECGCYPSAHLDLDCEREYNNKRLMESVDSRPAKKARLLVKYYQKRAQSQKERL